MFTTTTITFVCAFCSLAFLAAFNAARREFVKRRREQRFCQLVRKSVLFADQLPMRNRARVVKWQTCETTSAHCS